MFSENANYLENKYDTLKRAEVVYVLSMIYYGKNVNGFLQSYNLTHCTW